MIVSYEELLEQGVGFVGYRDFSGNGELKLFEVVKVRDNGADVHVIVAGEEGEVILHRFMFEGDHLLRPIFTNRQFGEDYLRDQQESKLEDKVNRTKENLNLEGFVELLYTELDAEKKKGSKIDLRLWEQEKKYYQRIIKHYFPNPQNRGNLKGN